MAHTPRASIFWSDPPAMSSAYSRLPDSDRIAPDDDDPERQSTPAADDVDSRTPLDKTIDRIGMGAFHFVYGIPISLCLTPYDLCRPLPMDIAIAVWIWCVFSHPVPDGF